MIVAEAPAARLEIVQSSASAVVVHVPAVVVAETKLTLTGAASATFTLSAASGPAFETTSVYVIGAVPPPCGSCTDGVAAFVTEMSALGTNGGCVSMLTDAVSVHVTSGPSGGLPVAVALFWNPAVTFASVQVYSRPRPEPSTPEPGSRSSSSRSRARGRPSR